MEPLRPVCSINVNRDGLTAQLYFVPLRFHENAQLLVIHIHILPSATARNLDLPTSYSIERILQSARQGTVADLRSTASHRPVPAADPSEMYHVVAALPGAVKDRKLTLSHSCVLAVSL